MFTGPDDLTGLLMLDERECAALVGGTPVITDDHPYTEFPLWRRLAERRVGSKPYTGMDVLRWKTERAQRK